MLCKVSRSPVNPKVHKSDPCFRVGPPNVHRKLAVSESQHEGHDCAFAVFYFVHPTSKH
jgi:hypothetical protein